MTTTTSLELRICEGEMTPLHMHPTDELIVVVEGRIAVHAGSERRELGVDETYMAPADVPHAVGGLSDVARFRTTASVSSAESYAHFSMAVAAPGQATREPAEDDAVVEWFAAQNGIAVLGPPGSVPDTV